MRQGSDVRREVFLIFKESLNNLLRYARCSRAEVRLVVDGSSLVLTIEDDGVGFDRAKASEGLGLRSMRERAGRLVAELQLRSAPGEGTTVRVVVPLGRRRRNIGAPVPHLPAGG